MPAAEYTLGASSTRRTSKREKVRSIAHTVRIIFDVHSGGESGGKYTKKHDNGPKAEVRQKAKKSGNN